MPDVVLVCEGRHDRIDQQVLDHLVMAAHRAPGKLKSAGGSGGLGTVGQFLVQESARGPKAGSHVTTIVFTVKDRDFRPRSDADATWADPKCRNLVWRRHEMENYLLDPAVVHEWFESLRRKSLPGIGVRGLPANFDEVVNLLRTFAEVRREHHAGQLLHWEMLCTYQPYQNAMALQRPKRSGEMVLSPARLPAPSRSHWLEALNRNWQRITRTHRNLHLPKWSTHRIRTRYDEILDQFDSRYFTEREYLLDFEGKGLLWALCDYVKQTCHLHTLKEATVEQDLLFALPIAYQKHQPFRPDEFKDLAQRMAQASK